MISASSFKNISNGLAVIPSHLPVIFLLRHAERYPIAVGEVGEKVPLTEEGKLKTKSLSCLLGNRLVHVASSPILRCLETANSLQEDTNVKAIQQSTYLGNPGVFIQDEQLAWRAFLEIGAKNITKELSLRKNQNGFISAELGTRLLLEYFIRSLDKGSGIYAFITHDYILALFICTLLNIPFSDKLWPDYLEGAFIWQEQGLLKVFYKQVYDKKRFQA